MPALRGLLASLGASVSLVAAGALALLAISAVIGVVGWPALGIGGEGGPLSIGEMTVPRSEVPAEPEDDGPLTLAEAPEEPAAAPAAEPVAGEAPPAVAAAGAPVVDRPRLVTPPDDGSRDRPDPPRPVPPGPSAPLAVQPAGPGGGLTGVTGEVVRTTGQTLAPATNTVLPGSGNLVEALTDDLANTVKSTGHTLAATGDLLLNGRR